MYHIAEAMVRWLAPILTFTAEEIWQSLPGVRTDSVFLSNWHALPKKARMENIDWDLILDVRQAVSKELERVRAEGEIGAPLDAWIHIFCEPNLMTTLETLGDELRFVFITSEAKVSPEEQRPKDSVAVCSESTQFWIKLGRSEEGKCTRCWHRRDDVGSYDKHEELCGRCVGNVEGSGELRVYA